MFKGSLSQVRTNMALDAQGNEVSEGGGGGNKPPATIPYSRFKEELGKNATLKKENEELKSRSAHLDYLDQYDKIFSEKPELIEGVNGVLKGTHKMVPVDPETIEDPNLKALLQRQNMGSKELEEIRKERAADKAEREEERHFQNLKENLAELSAGKFPFLKDEKHKNLVLRSLAGELQTNPDATMEEVAQDYFDLHKDTLSKFGKPAYPASVQESKKVIPIQGGGGSAAGSGTKDGKAKSWTEIGKEGAQYLKEVAQQ